MGDHEMASNTTNVSQAQVVMVGNNNVVRMSGASALPPEASNSAATSPTSACSDELIMVVDKVAQFIRQDYSSSYRKANRNPVRIEQMPFENFFVNLELKCVDSGRVLQNNDGDPMYKVFNYHTSNPSSRVLIYGNPASGKTTLCTKYAFDWANNVESRFRILIFLDLNRLQRTGTFEEILDREVFCKRLTQEERVMFFKYMKNCPKEFLFLLDGVSEYDLTEVSDIKCFLLGKKYRGVHLIATIRSSCHCLEMSNTFNARYCLGGYSKKNVERYISKYFRYDTLQYEVVLEHLKNSQDLMELCQVPLFLLLLCELWEKYRGLPTWTQVLTRYIEVCLKLFTSKFKKEVPWQDFWSSLAELAVSEVTEKSCSFTKDDLAATCKEVNVDCVLEAGFLDTILAEELLYKFPHEKVQQYFLARWLIDNWQSQKAKDVLEVFVKQASETPRFGGVLVFITGLLSEGNDKKTKLKRKDEETLLEFLKQIATSKGAETAEKFLQESCFCTTMDLLLSCVFEAWNSEDLCSTNRSILGLFTGFEPFKKCKTLTGYPMRISNTAACGLGIVISKLKLERLCLKGVRISDSAAREIAAKCLQKNSSLETVKFSHSCLSPKATEIVCEAFSTMFRLREIDLSCCNLGNNGLRAIAKLIPHGDANIHSLQLGNRLYENCVQREIASHEHNHIFSRQESMLSIGDMARFHETCEVSSPDDESVLALIGAIQGENMLEDISLSSCCVGNCGQEWIEAFAKNTQLKRIKLHCKGLDETQQEDLAQLVKERNDLENLSVVLEIESSFRKEYSTLLLLEETSRGRFSLSFSDHTHTVNAPLLALASFNYQTG